MSLVCIEREADWWAPWREGETARLWQGRIPLLLSLPHDGAELPPAEAARLDPGAADFPDTDWHVSRLYDFAREMGAYVLRPRYSRYLIDLNRPADGAALYPGRTETGLCPLQRFDGGPVWRDGMAPTANEIAARLERYWQPYHRALRDTLDSLRAQHARVLLWDGHSIRGHCPMFFDGKLPDYNLGTADGRSCAAELRQALAECMATLALDHVLDGRFKGGHITRHYGQPERGIHAVQMELVQSTYMDEAPPYAYAPDRAGITAAALRALLARALEWLG